MQWNKYHEQKGNISVKNEKAMTHSLSETNWQHENNRQYHTAAKRS
jgi:hypothetical protein